MITQKSNWNRDISSNCSVSQIILRKSDQISWKSAKFTTNIEKIELFSMSNFENSMKICWNIEVWAVQKHANLVDLVKSFSANSNEYLLAKFGFRSCALELRADTCVSFLFWEGPNETACLLASIQPRTSHLKFDLIFTYLPRPEI